jgi:hypothetical protein
MFNEAVKFYAGDIGVRVVHHVQALGVAYCPRDPDPTGPQSKWDARQLWPKSAAFTLARGVLEGVSVCCWLMAPSVQPTERVRRVALLELWSAKHSDSDSGEPSALPDAIAQVEELGHAVVDAQRNPGILRAGMPPARFSFSGAIREVFGAEGVQDYSRWSGRAHHALWASKGTMNILRTRQGEREGFVLNSVLEEPAHLLVAARVAELLARLVDDKAAYYGQGRDGTELRKQSRYLRECADAARAEMDGSDPNPSGAKPETTHGGGD